MIELLLQLLFMLLHFPESRLLFDFLLLFCSESIFGLLFFFGCSFESPDLFGLPVVQLFAMPDCLVVLKLKRSYCLSLFVFVILNNANFLLELVASLSMVLQVLLLLILDLLDLSLQFVPLSNHEYLMMIIIILLLL